MEKEKKVDLKTYSLSDLNKMYKVLVAEDSQDTLKEAIKEEIKQRKEMETQTF